METANSELSVAEAAKLFGCEPAEVRPVFGSKRRLALVEVVRGYLERLSQPSDSLVETRAESADCAKELLNVAAETREIKAELIDGEAFREAEVESVIGKRLQAVTARLNNLGSKLAVAVVGQVRSQVEVRVTEEVQDGLAELIAFDARDFACPKLYFESDEEADGHA